MLKARSTVRGFGMIIARRFLRNHWGKALTLLALLGAFALVWWLLPATPTTSWEVQETTRLLQLSRDGRVLLANVDRLSRVGIAHLTYGELQVWDTSRGKLITRLLDDNAAITAASLAPNGKYVAAWFPNGQLKVFATDSGS